MAPPDGDRFMRTITSTGAAAAVLAACVFSSCATAPADQAWDDDDGQVETGRMVAVEQCSSCHAIDQDLMSPRPGAPPMSTLLARYDPEMLANDLIEGIRVGHDDMPHFDFNIIATDALIAYLKSIER
jgi:mono/diheme cytochrome c family protein